MTAFSRTSSGRSSAASSDETRLAGSFQFLHSRELVWSALTRERLLGERLRPNDLMAWNADVTRMPAAMHSEYLRRCYLRNELAEGLYPVEGEPVSLADIPKTLRSLLPFWWARVRPGRQS